MTAIAKKLHARLNRWAPETAKRVKQLVAEIIELADHDALDLVRSSKVEQEVLDIILTSQPQLLPSLVYKAVVHDFCYSYRPAYLGALPGQVDEKLHGLRFDRGIFG
jgi:hypothetical protein